MANGNSIIATRLFGSDGTLTDAPQISYSETGLDSTDVSELGLELLGKINTLANAVLNSNRAFQRFNTDIIIDGTNVATYHDINNLYTAQVDKLTDVQLPTDAEIATSGVAYPIVFEFSHLAGTARIPGNNILRFFIKDGDSTNIDTPIGIRKNYFVERDDVIILSKESSGLDWQVSTSLLDPKATLLPEGTFALQNDLVINIDNITSELTGVSVVKGYGYLVDVGGTRFGTDILANDVIVALINNPSTATDSEDWLIIRNTNTSLLSTDSMLFLNQITRDGTRFDASSNIFVNEANVIEFNSLATGVPLQEFYFTSANPDGTTARSVTYPNRAIKFSALLGGTLTLNISFLDSSSSGFLPELTDITFDYGAHQFTFPLTGADVESGNLLIDIAIPNVDYTSILNTNCDIIFNYQFRGSTFIGTFTIEALRNSLDGTLRQSISDLADSRVALGEMRVNSRIDQLAHEIDNDGSSLEQIRDRISPYKTITVQTPDINARFLDSTGSDSPPTTISSMDEVSVDNPIFGGTDIALYVAAIAPASHILKNITTSTDTALNASEPNVDVLESLSFNGNTYFVYQVTGLTAGHVYEVTIVESQQVVAWSSDIANLENDIDRIDAELEHALLNLDPEVVEVLENDLNVTEENNPTVVATAYNIGLGSGTNQKVFYEPNANTPSAGTLTSRPMNENTGNQVGRKLAYFDSGNVFTNSAILWAFDGSTQRDLIEYVNGNFIGKIFVPEIPGGTTVQTIYPAQATRVSGAGIWQTLDTLTFVNGIPTNESSEIFFTRQNPSVSTTLTIQYRGHANGNIFGANTVTLAGVGGSTEVATTFALSVGSEVVNVEVRWYPSTRRIRVSETERQLNGLPVITDLQVVLSFQETRNVPATPATVRDVTIGNIDSNSAHVFAVRPSDTNTLVLISDNTEIDTQYTYDVLFDNLNTGHLTIATEQGIFLNYEGFDPIATTVMGLENHAELPQRGLFTTEFSHLTTLNLETQMTVRDSSNTTIKVGTELILTAPNLDRYTLSVANDGSIITTKL